MKEIALAFKDLNEIMSTDTDFLKMEDKNQKLDEEIKASIIAAVESTGRKYYGYQRSLELNTVGQDFHFWNAVFSCTRRHT